METVKGVSITTETYAGQRHNHVWFDHHLRREGMGLGVIVGGEGVGGGGDCLVDYSAGL